MDTDWMLKAFGMNPILRPWVESLKDHPNHYYRERYHLYMPLFKRNPTPEEEEKIVEVRKRLAEWNHNSNPKDHSDTATTAATDTNSSSK